MAEDRTELVKVASLAAAGVGLVVKAIRSLVGFVRRVDRIEAAQAGLVRDEDLSPQLARIRMDLRVAQLHAERDGATVAGELALIAQRVEGLERRLSALEQDRRQARSRRR